MATQKVISVNGNGSPEVLAEYFVRSAARKVNERIAASFMEYESLSEFQVRVLDDITKCPDAVTDFNKSEVEKAIAEILFGLGVVFRVDKRQKGRPPRYILTVDGMRITKSEFARRYGDGKVLVTWNRVGTLLKELKNNGVICEYAMEKQE